MLIVYIIDNIIYAWTYGLKKKSRVSSLFYETVLIFILMALCVVEIIKKNFRFN